MTKEASVPEIMDIRQLAKYLGVSVDTAYNFAKARTIPAFKLGGNWRFKKSIIDEWIVKQCEKGLK